MQNVTVQLTPNIQLMNTPGHTDLDISVIVKNVPMFGTVAVVGSYNNHYSTATIR